MTDSRNLFAPLAATVLLSVAAAQNTFVVDASGGGQFRDIPPALLAAKHGDVLDVRPGIYTCGATDQGVRIVGGAGRLLRTGTLVVTGLPANRTFSIVGFAQATASDHVAVRIQNCAGPVSLAELGGTPCQNLFARFCPAFRVEVADSSAVSVTDSVLFGHTDHAPALSMVGASSGLTVTRCTLTGDGAIGGRGLAAVEIRDGQASFVAATVQGAHGSSLPRVAGGRALVATGGRVRAARSSFNGGFTIVFISVWREVGLWIGAAADVTIDPSVNHSTGFSPQLPRVAVVPAIDAPPLGFGGMLTPNWSGGLGRPCVLAASVAGPRVPVPWGDLWLDPTVMVTLYIGPAVATPVTLRLGPAFTSGTAVTLQGLIASPRLLLTNPQTLVVR